MRSVSFSRSWAAPRTGFPRAPPGGEREQRQLVDHPRHLRLPHGGCGQRSRAGLQVATASPPARRRSKIEIRAPIGRARPAGRHETGSRRRRGSTVRSPGRASTPPGTAPPRRCRREPAPRPTQRLHRRDRHRAPRRTGAPAARSIVSVWSRVKYGSWTTVRPPRSASRREAAPTSSGHSRARADARPPAARNPRCAPAASRRSSRSAHPSSGARRRDPRPASPKRLVAREDELAFLAGQEAHQELEQRAGVAAVDRLSGRPQPAQPHASHGQHVDVVLDDLDAERPHRVHGRLGVRRAPEALDPRLALADPTDEHSRWEIDLSPGTPMWPTTAAAGSILIRPARGTTTPYPCASSSAAARSASSWPATSTVRSPPRSATGAGARSPRC